MMRLISKTVRQEGNSSGNLQRSNLVWALIKNVVLLETLDDLDTLDKFSYTFRSSRSHIIFSEKKCLKNFVIFIGKHLCWSLFLISRPATLLIRDSNTGILLYIAKF